MRQCPKTPLIHPFSGWDVPRLVSAHAKARPDHPFLIWEPFSGPAQSWTYGEFEARITRIAAGLSVRGVRAGDRLLVHLDNCAEAVLIWYGCARLGAVPVTTNARSVADDLNYFATHSGAVAAVTQPKYAELVNRACPDLKWIAVTEKDNGDEPASGHAPAPSDSFDAIDADPDKLPARAADPMAPAGIQYTSGTTSRPKGVLWTHANALYGARMMATYETLRPDDVHLCYLPLFHTNAQAYSILAALWVGATVVVQPRFSASRFWEVSLKHRCSWTSMVPFCLKAIAGQPVPDHSYRMWGNGVCDLPSDAHFGVKTIGWWGMTETISVGTVGLPYTANTPMTMGLPCPDREIAILRPDGTPVEPGETGDFRIRGVPGLSLFAEYINNPQATEDSFDEDGFFITGDRVTLREDGYLQFADRDKDMLKVGGENVAASEIERVIMESGLVAEAAVVARRHPMLDEVPVAFVLVPGGPEAAAPDVPDRILANCRERLADFKVPREIRIVPELPRSTLEKIAKAQLRDLLAREDAKAKS